MNKFGVGIILLACLLASVAHGLPKPEKAKLSWDEYKKYYNKHYATSEEESLRKTIYENRLEEIEHFNLHKSEKLGFQKGINHLTDLTDDEYMGLNGLRSTQKGPKTLDHLGQLMLNDVLYPTRQPGYELPESVDWTTKSNRVGPVKDQGRCGSCWAFATVGIFEGQEYKNSTSNYVVELSEQNLVDCDTGSYGCQGGMLTEAIDFAISEGGLMTEKDYPYASGAGASFECSYDRTKSFVTTWRFKNSYVLPGGDEETLKKVVATYGPVGVGIDASSPHFRDYTSGVYYDKNCLGKMEINHAVLVVGYGTDEKQGDYWLVKNSWSTHWGDKGYFKLARNRDNHCGVADMATIAV